MVYLGANQKVLQKCFQEEGIDNIPALLEEMRGFANCGRV